MWWRGLWLAPAWSSSTTRGCPLPTQALGVSGGARGMHPGPTIPCTEVSSDLFCCTSTCLRSGFRAAAAVYMLIHPSPCCQLSMHPENLQIALPPPPAKANKHESSPAFAPHCRHVPDHRGELHLSLPGVGGAAGQQRGAGRAHQPSQGGLPAGAGRSGRLSARGLRACSGGSATAQVKMLCDAAVYSQLCVFLLILFE